jgi:hypothetical protein
VSRLRRLGAGVVVAGALALVVATPAGAVDPAAKVLIVSYPGLQWDAVATAPAPALDGLLRRSAVASLSIRTPDAVTTLPDGYLTIGAGNRASSPPGTATIATDQPDGSVAVSADAVAAARRDADRRNFGAEPGALGTALAGAGRVAAVVGGPAAALAMMDGAGRVPLGTVSAPTAAAVVAAFEAAWPRADVTLVELADPADPVLGRMLASVDPARDLVMVVAPAAPDDAAELTTFAIAGPGIAPGRARSATTRRDGYVTLPDVGVTVLEALGVEVPDAMNGTEISSGGGAAYGATTAGELADANTIAVFRDRTVGPVSVAFVALQIVTYLVAMALLVRGRRQGAGIVAFVSLVIVALPAVTFLAGLVRYDRLGLAGYTVAVFAAAGALAGLAAITRRWHPVAPVLVLVALNWVVQVVDLLTGGNLQLDTTFGYSPIVAGRFQGIGNLAFAVLVGAALVVATGVWGLGAVDRPYRPDRWWAFAVALFAVTVVVDGWPALGADVGGVLASVPAFALVVTWLGGWRVSVRRVVAIGAATVAVLVAFVLVDLARPARQRTHLGRFVAEVFDGEAGVTVRRKLEANWHVLTSSVFAVLVPALVVGFAVLVVRRRGLVADAQARQPGLRPCLLGAVVAGGLGFAVNDSGVAIPAMMIAMVVPWLLLHLFASVPEP